MMSYETIQALNRKAARDSARRGVRPYIVEEGDVEAFIEEGRIPFPYIGERNPRGFKPTGEVFFVDATGMDTQGPAMHYTRLLREKVRVGYAYAITSAGQFQVYVTEYEPRVPGRSHQSRWNRPETEGTYRIVRFRQGGPNRVVRRGLTLEQAQEHCSREETHGEGWFDGYEKEGR